MNRLILHLVSGFTVLLAALTPARAQSKTAADANAAAYTIYLSGDYKAAAAAYERILKDFPTDGMVSSAQLQLAFSYYFLAQSDQASAILAKASSGPPLPPELKQIADGLLPQILSAKAAAMPASDPNRKNTFDEAIRKFTDYITAYPQAQDLENAIFSRAVAEYQVAKYDDAIKDLELNLQKFPQSSTLSNTRNLLAVALATVGSTELMKGDDPARAKAFALYKRAADLLREIIKKKEDIALINEANFQLGEILLNQAGFSPESERPALYAEALSAYRSVAPKERIIALQEDKLREFPEKRAAALRAKNANLKKQVDRDNERELKKLSELQGKPDQTATALLKMAEIYFQQGKNNEARVVLKHVTPHLTEDQDKKRSLYFTTMTYALQNAAERATAGYNEFESKYKGDALADNLPVAMGSMYLSLNNPNEAIRFLNESLALYPKGRFAGLSVVQKANAETRLGNLADALKTFQDYLAQNPPPEIGAIAQTGIAGIYKDSGKWEDAVAAYNLVKTKYAGTPQAVEADYWIGICTQQKGDNAAAAPILDAFAKANPKNALAPLALYAKGGALIALGKKDEGIAAFASMAEQYPDSQPAPFTYFMRAQLRASEGKPDDVIALMKQFIEKYPKNDKVYFAFESIAQAEINAGKADAGLATYREFVEKYPDSPQAGDAMFKIAELQRAKADSLGRYSALGEQERSQWDTLLEGSIATSEETIKKYPDSASLAIALQTLLQSQRMLLGAELKKAPDVEHYFQSLADSSPSPNAKSKILFTLASYVSEQDKPRALTIMTQAYKPEIVYSPQDMDFYGLALVGEKKFDEAAAIFEKLAKDYPVPANVLPNQASQLVQEAQAIALFGRARVAQEKGQTADAGKLFQELKALYPWSPKVLEADYGIAQSLKEQGKLDDAATLLTSLIRAPTATAELRANGMLLGGSIMAEKAKAAADQQQKDEYLGAAIDYFIKIAQFYSGVPTAAATGLWMGGQLLEQQANASADAKFKTQQLGKAKASYQQLLKDYPNSEFASKAKERLTALGG
ncbi:MAG: tetratricopeptide repeat protein [Terrimicrobiaceae bacterium]